MMPTEIAIGLALAMLILGIGFSWWWFGDDLRAQDKEIEKLDADLAAMTAERDELAVRASDAEGHIELLLGEGESRPLSAPLQVIRGGIR